MLKFQKINHKLIFYFLSLALIPLIISTVISINISQKSIKSQAFNQLESIRAIKKHQLTNYITSLQASLQVLNNSPYAAQAFTAFSQAMDNSGIKGEQWIKAEKQYAKRFKSINEVNSWYDLFFINLKGDIVFTVAKESDLGMNIPKSVLKNTSMGIVFNKAKSSAVGSIAVSDFMPYPPSNNEPAAFMMTKLINVTGAHVGYVALQFPLNKVNQIMQQRDGMGRSGETYLVGQDKLMRSDSFLDPKAHSVVASFAGNVQNNGIDTEAVRAAFSGESASRIITDYNGNPVLSSFTTFGIADFKWALIVEIDEAEIFEISNNLVNLSVILVIIASLVIAIIGFFIAKNISQPIIKVVSAVKKVAAGDLTTTIKIDQHDELGQLQQAMSDMVVKLKGIIEHIANSSHQQAAASQELSSITELTTANVTRQHLATDQVATAINEMTVSIDEVSHNTTEACSVADESTRLVNTSVATVNETIEQIVQLSDGISKSKELIDEVQAGTSNIVNILVVIKGIADQTNLLALNAAIEAARAGEQGRGFAVVADEVRTLAQNTQNSTIEIENMIQSLEVKVAAATNSMEQGTALAKRIVDRTNEVTGSLTEVESSVMKISEMNIQISAATQEQSSVARDISQQSTEINDISLQTGASAKEIAAASDELATLAAELAEQVNKFKI
ncbi:MAG: methyl-accepting chemotaxis protein [Gammaproteobacteria bacterium]|nr:methyl-accepting chemotaxis protein [Gammaproteobacteria bacterium]